VNTRGRLLRGATAASAALLLTISAPAVTGHADTTTLNPPTFANYAAPAGVDGNTGEPSIGVNWRTGNVMYESGTNTLRVSFDDTVSPATATWTDVSPPTSVTSLDPISFTDPVTGHTVVSQLVPPCSLSSVSDDDGATWIPAQGCGLPGAADHQTVGGGPFAAPVPGNPVSQHAVYYCGQNLVDADCAVSLDGGLTYGPSTVLYTDPGLAILGNCRGLHGHIKVSPDGTAYVPNQDCDAGLQGAVVSANNGVTWTVHDIPDSTQNSVRSDPAVATSADNTVYFAYEDGNGSGGSSPIKVAVSHDHGGTWAPSIDVSTPAGVAYGVMPAAVAGDGNRAAVAFYGSTVATTIADNYENSGYPGVWDLFVSYTYDGGQTWTTVDATPGDPIQRGCIYWGNGSCPSSQRNLLDFFDMTVDAHGRVLVGYVDGCVNACVTGGSNSRSSHARIARQTGGLGLFSQYDSGF